MNLERRVAKVSDEDFIRTTYKSAYYGATLRQLGKCDDALLDGYFDRKWIPEKFEVIVKEGEPCGFLSVELHIDHIFLSELVVSPENQGLGIGTRILKDEINKAHDTRLPIRLRVLKQSRAIDLYKRNGFRQYNESENQILMEWSG